MKFYSSQHRPYNATSHNKRRGNPYFSNRRSDNFGTSKTKNFLAQIPPKVWLWFFVFIILLIVLVWLFLFSNILIIKKVEVSGTVLVPSFDIENLANQRLDQNRFLIFSESRLAVFNSKALKQAINERYVVDNIKITKKIPATITIEIFEKTPAAVWFEADSYQTIDDQGWVLALASGNVDGLPTIYNNGSPKINNKKIDNMNEIIAFSKNLMPEFSSRFPSIKIKQLIIDNDPATIKLVPERGALIYFSTLYDLLSQVDRLDLLLRSELKGRFEKTQYIDLRFGNRVNYK